MKPAVNSASSQPRVHVDIRPAEKSSPAALLAVIMSLSALIISLIHVEVKVHD